MGKKDIRIGVSGEDMGIGLDRPTAIRMKSRLFLILILGFLMVVSSCSPQNSATPIPSVSPAVQETTTLSCFISHPWYPVDTFTGIIPEQITLDTGITLDLTIAVDSQQLSVLIASGDLTDLVYTDTSLDKLSNPDLCHSYDDLIAQYGIDWDIPPTARENALLFSTDSKAYFLFNHDPGQDGWDKTDFGVPMAPSLSLRKDMLDEMGHPRLETLDDLSRILADVKERYPDMIPLVFDPSWRFNIFRVWTGVTQQDWIQQENGSYQFYAQTAPYKNMLRLLNDYYKQGYLIADNFAEAESLSSHWYELGKAFAMTTCTQNSNIGYTNKLKKINPDFTSIECPPLSKTDYVTSDIGWSGTFITKSSKSPEEAIRFLRYLFSPYAQKLTQMGREGVEYTMDVSTGKPVFSKEWMSAIEQGTHDSVYNPWFYFGGSEVVESMARCASLPDYDKDYRQTYDAIRSGYRNEPWIAAATFTGNSKEKVVIDKIQELIIPFEAKIILSDSDEQFDANYDEFQDALNQMGLSALAPNMGTRINEMRERYGQ